MARFQAVNQKLQPCLAELREQAIALGREPVADRLLAELDVLHQHRFRVVVIGEFSRGKSTFVNALLGQKLLPAKIRPTTAVLTSVRHGEDPDARVFLAGGHAAKSVAVADLGPVLMGKAADLGPVQRVELRRPLPTGLEDIELIDTPGVGDLCESREDVTLQYLPQADAVLFLLDAKACLSESERRFLQRHVVRANLHRVFFVINKADQLSPPYCPDTLAQLQQRVRAAVADLLPSAPVLAVAAKPALVAAQAGDAGDPAARHLAALVQAVSAHVVQEQGQVLIERAVRMTEECHQVLAEALQLQQIALDQDHARAAELLRHAQTEAGAAQAELRERRAAFEAACGAVVEQASARAATRAADASRRIDSLVEGIRPGQLDEAELEAELHDVLKGAFVEIYGAAQAEIAQGIRDAGGGLAKDVAGLQGRFRPVSGGGAAAPGPGEVAVESSVLTPLSSMAGLGAMGVAALLTSLSGVGLIFVGIAALLSVRAAEEQAAARLRRVARDIQRRVATARERMAEALAEDGARFAAETWERVASGHALRVQQTLSAAQEAESLLGLSTEERSAETARLRGIRTRLDAVRDAARANLAEALVGAR